MTNRNVKINFWITILSFGAIVIILCSACGSSKKISATDTQETWLLPFIADSAMSADVVYGRTFYTDSVLVDLRNGSRRFIIEPKTSCFLDTVVTAGRVNGKDIAVKGYIATFANGKKLFYMVQDKTMMPLLTPLFNHPDSVMIDAWSSTKTKEIWALFGGKGSRLFYDPSEVVVIPNATTPVVTKTAVTVSGTTPATVSAPTNFVTDTIRGVDYKKKLVKPRN